MTDEERRRVKFARKAFRNSKSKGRLRLFGAVVVLWLLLSDLQRKIK